MNILVINCGGASVKFLVATLSPQAALLDNQQWLARGRVEGLGHEAALRAHLTGGAFIKKRVHPPSHEGAVRRIIEWCRQAGLSVDAVGHLMARGGERFARPILVDEAVSASLEILQELAPRQNAAGIAGLQEARAVLGRDVPMVAVFDTAFHVTMPERACLYALPRDNGRRLAVRRYGSHGVSYRYLVERYSRLAGTPMDRATLVAFHLGQSCSAAAIAGGRSIDTSTGFTPLEGLVTGTGCGDLDPSVVGYLARTHGLSLEAVETLLGEKSGLAGLSGLSSDMRELVDREPDSPAARLAVDLFCYRARKYLGAYLAALGGADAVVFSGGIGENMPSIRQRICEGAEWCGLVLDPSANRRAVGAEAEIGARGSRLRAFVIPTDEEAVIARDTAACLQAAAAWGGAVRAG